MGSNTHSCILRSAAGYAAWWFLTSDSQMQTTLCLIIMLEFKRIGSTAKTCAGLLKACCMTVHYAPSPTREGTVDL
jgi:hypothetical protein